MPKTTTTTTETGSAENMPVLAYRVGLVEIGLADLKKTVELGQDKLDKKLTDLMLHFATNESLDNVKREAHEEHQRIWSEIKATKADVGTVQLTVDSISRSNVSMSLAQKIVFTAIGIILIAIINGFMDKIIK